LVRASVHGVELGWRPPHGGPKATGYVVLRGGKRIGKTGRLKFTDRHVRAGKTYRYTVRAHDKAGDMGRPSRTLRVHIPAASGPGAGGPSGAPVGVHASALSNTQIAVGWSPPGGKLRVAAYDVYRDGTLAGSVTGRAYVDSNLAPGTTYSYQVDARDVAGHRSPRSAVAKATTAVGPSLPVQMTQAMVDRMFWRAGFGPSAADRQQWIGRRVDELVDHFLTSPQSYPATPTPPTNGGLPLDPLASNDDLVMEWLYRMQTAVNPFTERLTLFWHRHFAVSRSSGIAGQWLLAYRNRLARYGALAANPQASFRALALEMTTQDGAMSYFLTGYSNVKAHPNENYAREFMELFCLGVHDALGNPNYAQSDVTQLARAFTGWHLDFAPASPTYGQTSFDASEFDGGVKTFLGHTGAFTAVQAVDVVLGHPSHAPYMITKLWHEFILAPVPPATLADLIATYTAGGQLLLVPLLRKILTHPLMFESLDEPNMIKPPVVYYVGVVKAMDAPLRDYWPAQTLTGMQQLLYNPPNVAGWEGGLSWLNTSTIAQRFDALISLQHLKYKTSFVDEGGSGETSQQAFDRAYAAVGGPWLSPATRQLLLAFSASTPSSDVYKRRERQYALRAFMLGGPDAQVM
jgi:uncharacterized protein (DUF1800 family)